MGSELILLLFFIITGSVGLYLWTFSSAKKVVNLLDLAISTVIGSFVITWILFLIANFTGELNLVVNSVLLFVLGIFALFRNIKTIKLVFPKIGNLSIILSIFYFTAFFYFFLVFRKLLFYENNNLVTGWINVWGDWAAHAAYATSFAYGQNFPPEFPIFSGRVFSYPFMSDFLSAILISLGVEMTKSLIYPSLLFTFISFVILNYLVFSITKKISTSGIATVLFFLNGGLGFIYALNNRIQINELTKIPQENIQWISVISSQFIPQRGFAMSFPLVLICFHLLHQIYLGNNDKKKYILTGFLISLLPLFHLHSFVVILFISFLLFIIRLKYFKNWLTFAIPILSISLYIFFHYLVGNSIENPIRFKLGWMAKDLKDIIPFWVKNFGIMMILPIVGLIASTKRIKILSIPFWFLFIISNLFIFQRWDWDNTKVLIYWYLMAVILASIFLEKLFSSKKAALKLLAIFLFIVAIASGATDAINLLRHEKNKILWFTKDQTEVADFIKNNTPPKSIFLTANNHDNLVSVLTGRKILMGFPGWLWSYSVDYNSRENDINIIKVGSGKSKELLNKYSVNYLLLGPTEKSQGFDKNYFDSEYETILNNDQYTLYLIK